MPPLDPMSEAVLAAYIENGGNQSDAWRAAHPQSRAKPASIHAKASAFFKQDKVRLRIVDLQVKVADKVIDGAALTLSSHMTKLAELRDQADARGQTSAAIQAEVKRGELMGLYIERRESTNTNYNISDQPLSEDEWKDKYGVGAPNGAANRPH